MSLSAAQVNKSFYIYRRCSYNINVIMKVLDFVLKQEVLVPFTESSFWVFHNDLKLSLFHLYFFLIKINYYFPMLPGSLAKVLFCLIFLHGNSNIFNLFYSLKLILILPWKQFSVLGSLFSQPVLNIDD